MAGPLRNKNIVFLSIFCAVMAAGAWHEGIISSKILKSSKGGRAKSSNIIAKYA